MRRGYVNVQTPLAPESLATVLTVHLEVKYSASEILGFRCVSDFTSL